ncbi:MAG: hypothetical protein QOD94_676 [Alphaproteobacteria bacterium]|jgi:hypothetical protein|nr:hypothetical protein [Alphaproteobacteria bacterium]
MDDTGGWLWLVIDVILVAALGIGIAYGILAWRRRRKDPAIENVRDAATHRAYENNEANRP